MTSIQGLEPTSLPASTAGSGRPDTATGVPASGWSRCPITLADAKAPRDQRRSRCIHPKGHWGPHTFGAVL